MRSLSALLCFLLVFVASGEARAAEPGSDLTISLLTMGPGAHPFTKFGHSAIWVHDAQSERDEVYNYGTFAFDSPTLLLDSVAGKLPYWLSVQSYMGTLRAYGEAGRSLQASELELTPAQRVQLYAALRENARPEHRYYRYDYYRDNCATRIRDVIDGVIGGRIAARTQPTAASMSFREHTLRLVADDPLLYAGLDLAVGRQTDAPITFWDEAFLPQKLHDALASTRVVRDGRELPLVRSERSLLSSKLAEPRAAPPSWSGRYQLVGLGLGALFGLLGWAGYSLRAARVVLGLAYVVLGGSLGLLGCALAYLTFFSAHSAAAANYNVLLVPPWLLLLAASGVGVMRGKPGVWRVTGWVTVATFLATDLALLTHLLTAHPQANAQELALALPLWMGVAFSAWLAAPNRRHSKVMPGVQP
jgi:hypothetical protein